jgi:hypothetical protein
VTARREIPREQSTESAMYKVSVAGYLLLEQPEEGMQESEYWRSFGRYCGVDRLPKLITADTAVRELIGEPPIQDPMLGVVIEEWLDTRSGKSAFIASRNKAIRLLNEFRRFQLSFEFVYCELAWKEGEEERLSDYPTSNEAPPAFSLTYGFDVSWPSCNHSAIFQPGVISNIVRVGAKSSTNMVY